MSDDAVLHYEPTGRKRYHPRSCGACLGAGCPEVRLTAESERELFDWLRGRSGGDNGPDRTVT